MSAAGNPTFDIIVIGAGFGGLSAGAELARSGARVLVLEARPRLGGRATAFVDGLTGELVDNGQHVLFGCYRETFRFLRTIGAEDRVRLQPALQVNFVDREGVHSQLSCPSLPAPLHLLAGVLEWDALSFSDRLEVFRLARVLRVARSRPDGELLVSSRGETVRSWLVIHGQGPRIREMLWEPLALAALNQAPEDAAAPTFVRVLAEMFGQDQRDAAVGIPLQPLHRMFAEPAKAFIESRGGEVRTGALATILVTDGRANGARLAGSDVRAPVVISSVPWHQLGALFPDPDVTAPIAPLLRGAASMRSSPIVTVNLWFDRPVIDAPFVGLPGRVMQWVFDKRWAFGEAASHLSLASSGAAAIASRPNEELIGLAATEVVESLPRARAARLLRATVVREPHATFSVAPGEPPRPPTETAIPGLLLAGDWIETGLPATIESAVVSGHRAASAALQRQ